MVEMPTVCLIGHTDHSLRMRSSEFNLPFGEVNHAKKLHHLLLEHQIPVTPILDIYELFGIDDPSSDAAALFMEMHQANIQLGAVGIDFITDYDNELTRTFRANLKKQLQPYPNSVLLLLSWPGRSLSLLSTGIQREWPVIGKEDSYIETELLAEPFPIDVFAKETALMTSESLLGAKNLAFSGVSLDKFVYLPNLAPQEAQELLKEPLSEQQRYREAYLQRVALANEKALRLAEDTIVIGCPCRFVRRKNVDQLIYAVASLAKKYPNILLLLKGNLDSEFDQFSMYSEKLHQLLQTVHHEPWFLWDKTPTEYPEVLKVYRSFDLCAHLSGAELGCNTVIEVCSLGVPLVLLNASVNPYLYREMALFVEAGDLCQAPWLYRQPDQEDLIRNLEQLIMDPEKRAHLGSQARRLAEERFGAHQILKRIPLMARAAWSFFQDDADGDLYKKTLIAQLKQDELDYQLPGAV